jgi:outer membrane biosynthesis protein TonB
MLTWHEKLSLLTTKGLTWKEVVELDKGLEAEKQNPAPEPKPEPEPEPTPEPKPEPEPEPDPEPTETEKKLLEKIATLESQLKDAQSDNVHGNNGGEPKPSFDEQLDNMFKDFRI